MSGKWSKIDVASLDHLLSELTGKKINKSDLSRKLGLSENGLAYAIREGSMKLTIFQDICEILNINPGVVFQCSECDSAKAEVRSEEFVTENKKLREEIIYLKKANEILMRKLVECTED